VGVVGQGKVGTLPCLGARAPDGRGTQERPGGVPTLECGNQGNQGTLCYSDCSLILNSIIVIGYVFVAKSVALVNI
jgi:hypothetical protein